MSINLGYLLSKFFRLINRPALKNCYVSRNASIGTGSNLIDVVVGRYSYCGKNCTMINTVIGPFCSIASYCAIGGTGHPLSYVSTSPVFYEGHSVSSSDFNKHPIPSPRQVTIGSDVWIGESVFIREGVMIGHGAVIGAHSVVTKNIPPYAIVAGSPAKILRYRFTNDQIEALIKSQWWNLPINQIKSLSAYMNDIDLFIENVNKI